MYFEDWLKFTAFSKPPTEEARELARMAWRAAEHNKCRTEVEIAVELIRSGYQKKRTQLKKQLTHFIGKFSIVTAENNKLRSMNKAITKRNHQLREYMIKAELTKHIKKIGGVGSIMKGNV